MIVSRSIRRLRSCTILTLSGVALVISVGESRALDLSMFGSPGGFVAKNVPIFKEGTRIHEEYFAAKYPDGCINPNPPKPPKPPKKKEEEPKPPVPGPVPNPPIPKPKPPSPGRIIITPPGDPGGEIAIELIDAVGEVDIPVSGFDPLNEQQVVDAFTGNDVTPTPVAAAQAAAAPAAAVTASTTTAAVVTPPATTFTATDTLGAPPDTAYFSIDSATGQITTLPTVAGQNIQAGTDNATTGFLFPITPYQFETPAIAPGLSATFALGSFTATIRNTATGDRFTVVVTITLTGVSISVTRL